jgi:hypothetical protein
MTEWKGSLSGRIMRERKDAELILDKRAPAVLSPPQFSQSRTGIEAIPPPPDTGE